MRTLITHVERKNVVRISFMPAVGSLLVCSYHVLTSSVRYQSTHALPNEIYFLSKAIGGFYFLIRGTFSCLSDRPKRGLNTPL